MPLDFDSLKAELTMRLGDPSDAELPDAQKELALQAALREFSRFRPRTQALALRVERGVTQYPLPAGAVGVSDLWVLPVPTFWTDPLNLVGENAALSVLAQYGFTAYDDLAWDVDVLGGPSQPLLQIGPVPDVGGPAVLLVEFLRTWDDVSERHQEALLLWAMGECIFFIGRKRSKPVTKIPTATGQLSLNTGYTDRAEGLLLKKQAREMMGQGASVAARG